MNQQFAIFNWTGNRLDKFGTFDSASAAWTRLVRDLSLVEDDYVDFQVKEVH